MLLLCTNREKGPMSYPYHIYLQLCSHGHCNASPTLCCKLFSLILQRHFPHFPNSAACFRPSSFGAVHRLPLTLSLLRSPSFLLVSRQLWKEQMAHCWQTADTDCHTPISQQTMQYATVISKVKHKKRNMPNVPDKLCMERRCAR